MTAATVAATYKRVEYSFRLLRAPLVRSSHGDFEPTLAVITDWGDRAKVVLEGRFRGGGYGMRSMTYCWGAPPPDPKYDYQARPAPEWLVELLMEAVAAGPGATVGTVSS